MNYRLTFFGWYALILAIALICATVTFAAEPPFDTKARLADVQARYQQNRTLAAALDQAAAAMQKEAEALQELVKREEAATKAKADAEKKPEPVKEIEK